MQVFFCLGFVPEKEHNDNDTLSARSPVFCGAPFLLLPTRVANPVARFVDFGYLILCVAFLLR